MGFYIFNYIKDNWENYVNSIFLRSFTVGKTSIHIKVPGFSNNPSTFTSIHIKVPGPDFTESRIILVVYVKRLNPPL